MAIPASDVVPISGDTLEAEHAKLVLAEDAITGLRQALAGHYVSDEALDQALGLPPSP
jgi:hypothetical protein